MADVTGRIAGDGTLKITDLGLDSPLALDENGDVVDLDEFNQVKGLAESALAVMGVDTSQWEFDDWGKFIGGDELKLDTQLALDGKQLGAEQSARLEQFTLDRRQLTLQEDIATYKEAIYMAETSGVVSDTDTGEATHAQKLQAKIADK